MCSLPGALWWLWKLQRAGGRTLATGLFRQIGFVMPRKQPMVGRVRLLVLKIPLVLCRPPGA